MRKIIEDIYCGRFSAVNRPIKRGSEYDRAILEVRDARRYCGKD